MGLLLYLKSLFCRLCNRWTRQRRIKAVTDRYTILLEEHPWYTTYHILILSGAAALIDQREMDLLIGLLPKPFGSPVNWLSPMLPDDRLLEFLKFCCKTKSEIKRGGYCAMAIAEFTGTLKVREDFLFGAVRPRSVYDLSRDRDFIKSLISSSANKAVNESVSSMAKKETTSAPLPEKKKPSKNKKKH